MAMNGLIQCLDSRGGENFVAYHGDCVAVLRQLPDNSIGFSVFSPPFSGLYIYGDSICDMGNSANDAEFFAHYKFFVRELYRVMKPGRIVAVHCKDLVYYKNQRGTAGLRDFPGALIASHTEADFDFHSRVTIWRSPVREMTKTKAHGLLYKQLRADSSFSRQGLPEYFVVFRKWAGDGDGVDSVTHSVADFPLERWQEWASPVWMDTRETTTLDAARARDPKDERHICPMPLDIIERAIVLWSNAGDTVLSPFMGIGSEGYVALSTRRKFIGIELKKAYFDSAVKTLASIDAQIDMFASA